MACASELFAGERATLMPLAGALVDQRLLTRSGDNYEVSHEALLRVAPLGALILALREKFLRVDMLAMEARDWWEHGRRGERIGRTGERLNEAQALLEDEDFGAMLSASALGVREYLAACVKKAPMPKRRGQGPMLCLRLRTTARELGGGRARRLGSADAAPIPDSRRGAEKSPDLSAGAPQSRGFYPTGRMRRRGGQPDPSHLGSRHPEHLATKSAVR
jgi:hypothetical protein